jgi:hypothetical protein
VTSSKGAASGKLAAFASFTMVLLRQQAGDCVGDDEKKLPPVSYPCFGCSMQRTLLTNVNWQTSGPVTVQSLHHLSIAPDVAKSILKTVFSIFPATVSSVWREHHVHVKQAHPGRNIEDELTTSAWHG